MTDRRDERFATRLRAWGERPTRLSPAAARARVLARLSEPEQRPAWRLIAAGATLAAGVLALTLLVGRRPEPVTPPAPTPAVAETRTIVHQLSSGTRLYIVLRRAVPADDC